MSERATLPLFPLGSVLYPGLVLPLHIFENRYRQLVRDLLDAGDGARFGIVAIREGRETGVTGVRSLYPVGCTAVLRQVQRYADGRYDIAVVGAQRFRLLRIDESGPYLRGEAEFLPERAGDPVQAGAAAQAVRPAFRGYLRALRGADPDAPDRDAAGPGADRGAADPGAADPGAAGRGVTHGGGIPDIAVPDLPSDPVALSYVIAALVVIDLPGKQALLAEPDAAGRLAAERSLLARETAMLRGLASAPAPGFRYTPYSNN